MSSWLSLARELLPNKPAKELVEAISAMKIAVSCLLPGGLMLVFLTSCAKKPLPPADPVPPAIQPKDLPADAGPSDAEKKIQRIIERARSVFRPIYFAYDQAWLSEDAKGVLTGIAAFAREFPDVAITIEGHCDERGTDEYNLALGEKRARAVFEYLSGLSGAGGRMKTISYGEEKPAEAGRDEASWTLNRRADFQWDF